MDTITIKPISYHNAKHAGIFFKDHKELNEVVRKVKGIKWSTTHRCWYVPLTREDCGRVYNIVRHFGTVEVSELKEYLKAEKSGSRGLLPAVHHLPATSAQRPRSQRRRIADINKHVLPMMAQRLKLKAYSESTIRIYLSEMAQLLQTLGDIPADELTPEHLKRYLVYCYERLGLKENTL